VLLVAFWYWLIIKLFGWLFYAKEFSDSFKHNQNLEKASNGQRHIPKCILQHDEQQTNDGR